jgi:hypothetical protein
MVELAGGPADGHKFYVHGRGPNEIVMVSRGGTWWRFIKGDSVRAGEKRATYERTAARANVYKFVQDVKPLL